MKVSASLKSKSDRGGRSDQERSTDGTHENGNGLWTARARGLLAHQITGPLLALVVACLIFSLTTETFLNAVNVSLIIQQTVVIGTLALGQTLVILVAGIDLANGATMVLGTVIIAKYALDGDIVLGLLLGFGTCLVAGAINGLIVARWDLPPFIVTLGMLTILSAAARLYTNSQSYPVKDEVLGFLGREFRVGGAALTYGAIFWILLTVALGLILSQTAWGTRVYAVGNSPVAARLTGVKVRRVLFSVYVVAGLIYAFAALQAMGRTPSADPSAYQTANLDSITAVVIGGTSLFGGRGGVYGTAIGALLVTVLMNGLTQAGIDSLYQQLAIGALVIVAVGADQIMRKRRRA